MKRKGERKRGLRIFEVVTVIETQQSCKGREKEEIE